jgi:hypothetical protein
VLLIRDAQLGIFQTARGRELERRLLRTLELDYPEDFAAMGAQGAAAFVSETLNSAAHRGVNTESAILGLMRLYVEFGRTLQLAPYPKWANETLDNPALPAALKVNVVSQRLFQFTQGRRILVHREDS